MNNCICSRQSGLILWFKAGLSGAYGSSSWAWSCWDSQAALELSRCSPCLWSMRLLVLLSQTSCAPPFRSFAECPAPTWTLNSDVPDSWPQHTSSWSFPLEDVTGIWSHHFMANTWGKVEAVTDFIFLSSKITAGDCSHKMRSLLLGRKAMTNPDSVLNDRNITLLTKVHLVKAMVFPVVMYGCESWIVKKSEC